MTEQDRIYRDPSRPIEGFPFDEAVARVFPDMIRRSIPAYETVVDLTGLLAARHLAGLSRDAADESERGDGRWENRAEGAPRPNPPPPLLAFDLGCSLGATTLALLRHLGDLPCRIVAVDNSPPMLARAAELVADPRVEFRLQDLRETDANGAQAVLMNYALQFIPPADRLGLLARLRRQMAPGGQLILGEKIAFEDSEDQTFFDAAHLAFKRANGYSELEIARKRTALEKVMIVDSEAMHLARLRTAGFASAKTWFRCLNWASFLAWA